MASKTEITKTYEAVLSIPGMNENIKIDLRIPRKNVLFLSKVIFRNKDLQKSFRRSVQHSDLSSAFFCN